MTDGLSIVLIALAGLLLGGGLSMRKQGKIVAFVTLIVLALLALAGGVLWQFGED